MEWYGSRHISDLELRTWLEQRFAARVFAINREPVADEVWVESHPRGGGDFPWRVEVYLPATSLEEELRHASACAQDTRCHVLASDERISPYTFVLLTPTGDMLHVDVETSALDESGTLIIAGPASHPVGRISSATRLEPALLTERLSPLLGVPGSQARMTESIRPPREPASPYEHSHPIVDGVHYRFTYSVSIAWEARPWRSLQQEAEDWEHVTARLARLYRQPFCAHSEHLEQVINIPGGSDSECRCIWLDGVGRREVLTKHRRRAW
ncbi:hypothetical protein A176_002999 [Myxococcus hansupus]|uniref:Uncharacterized protein n=2 Tax=Pseudomyxococcus hansupus TaxID=1297742 RepID=A0A0H4XDH4_9BACT|nr:hypothetical protein A176_002999 [Myxococcus hansupus]